MDIWRVWVDSVGARGYLNDLWSFNPATQQWTWVSGSNTCTTANGTLGQPGVYGSLGVAASANIPGGREGGIGWLGSDGELWLFGGSGFDGSDVQAPLNDLWAFNPTTGMWTWMGGPSTVNVNGRIPIVTNLGIYGTLGQASTTNIPGGRSLSAGWVDSKGDFWLFGGSGLDSAGGNGELNDLWMYDPNAKAWTWESGSDLMGTAGVYGTQGTGASGNTPGARVASAGWIDSQNNLWLFGGATFNDLWKFSPATNTWTWIGGSNQPQALPSYGTMGVASGSNVPGGRAGAAAWSSGNTFWMFGGFGVDSTGNAEGLNDLWTYRP